ncbi:BCCT family transporter [Umboniibacter marinipuniceus]|uniref:Choline/glycine/proline betaine transport protein n=1 Tax=Umboniibacter marinipuniceus TaxID=569599 RepID=A0A3M0ACT6_9GAMM|nr:BCCT family transporter [Umboniibacter marinipuniceus]RMA80285.1 choline/glycine/proline betaine transport protein [Umboniibacter marinipuniceus]
MVNSSESPQNKRPKREGISNVFITSSALLVALIVLAVAAPSWTEHAFIAAQSQIVDSASWFYVLVVASIAIALIYFAASSLSDIRLGPDDSRPDYSYPTWFSMLFSAGIGIGLLFFGVAEPVMHYLMPPVGTPETIEAAEQALEITFFHWGLHAWGIYALVGLALAYFGYRHNLPFTLRSTLYPVLGNRIYGPIGDSVDIFAIIGTVLGVATSLGFGVAQINAGLHYLFDVPNSVSIQAGIIVAVTILATASVLSGLNRGIRILSQVNMSLAVLLLILVFTTGETVHLMQTLMQNIGIYLSGVVGKTFDLYAYAPNDWIGGWTLFYWGWWISWSPFVGMFIAKISRGRTIREFILGVILIPVGFTFTWMTVFGNSAINLIREHGQSLSGAVLENNAIALFKFLEYFPMTEVVSLIAILMIVIFFVTSADSGALVVNMLAAKGNENNPVWQRIYWSFSIGLVAMILLFAGGLKSLQTATIISALPFSFVLLLIVISLMKSLNTEKLKRESMLNTMNTTPHDQDMDWRERINRLNTTNSPNEVRSFIREVGVPALQELHDAFDEQSVDSEISIEEDAVTLAVKLDDGTSFAYQLKLREVDHHLDALTDSEVSTARCEVYLREGFQHYDIMGYSEQQIIKDMLNHCEKHGYFVHLARKH